MSEDNLFVFVIIMTTFAVPGEHQHKVLTSGIVLALIMRAIFIAVGATLLALFSFNVPTVRAAADLHRCAAVPAPRRGPDVEDNVMVKAARRLLPITGDYVGGRLITRIDGRWMVTPLFLVLVDRQHRPVLRARLHSRGVGVTEQPYIVFTANAFALLGLRALFFLVKELLDRLVHLSTGLPSSWRSSAPSSSCTGPTSTSTNESPKSPPASLAVIIAVLAVVTVASLIKTRHDPTAKNPRRLTAGTPLRARRLRAGPPPRGAELTPSSASIFDQQS